MSQNCYDERDFGQHISSHAEFSGAPPNRNPNPILILTLTQRGPDYHQNLTVYCKAHVPPFHRILWKSAG